MTDAQSVARGDAPPDLVVRGGRVFLPETRTFVDRDVLVAGDSIAAHVEDATDFLGPDTTTIDATDRAVVPGFVDAHTHVDLHQTIETAYPAHLRGGTTTIVTEVASMGVVFGPDAVRELLDSAADLPLSLRALVPPAPLLDAYEPARTETADDYIECLDHPRVLGVGELSWPHLVAGPTGALGDLYDAAKDREAKIGAHGAGCRGHNLQTLSHLATDDHESITAEGHVERAAAGIHPIGRSGTIRDDAPAAAGALDDLDPSELSLSTDGAWPRTLHQEGSMDAAVRRVIQAGADPRDAIVCATRTPARHFSLDGKGTLAPGSDADILVLDDLHNVDVSSVVAGGDLVYHNHHLEVGPRTHHYPARYTDSVQFDLPDEALTVPESSAPDGRVNAIGFEGDIVTDATTVEPPARNGEFHASADDDILKAVIVDRHPDTDRGHFTGFLSGYGIEEGAVATTINWESATALAIGTDDDEIRAALHAVRETQGGWAVVHDGEVSASLPTPVAGFCSTRSIAETAKLEAGVRDALRRLGATPDRPLLAIQTLTFTGVPARKLTCSGYAEIREKSVVGLTPD